MANKITIGKVAKATGLSPKAIRNYEEKGLLSPRPSINPPKQTANHNCERNPPAGILRFTPSHFGFADSTDFANRANAETGRARMTPSSRKNRYRSRCRMRISAPLPLRNVYPFPLSYT